MALSVVAGFWLMRTIIGSTTLNDTDEQALTRRLEQVFDLLLDG